MKIGGGRKTADLNLAKKFFPDLNYEQIEKDAASKQL